MVSLFQVLAFFKMEALIDALLDGNCHPGVTVHGIDLESDRRLNRLHHKWWAKGADVANIAGISVVSAKTEDVIAETMDGVVVDTYLTDLQLLVTVSTWYGKYGGHLVLVTEAGTHEPLEFVYMTDTERAQHIRESPNDFVHVTCLEQAAEWAEEWKEKDLKVPDSMVLRIDAEKTWVLEVTMTRQAFKGLAEVSSRPASDVEKRALKERQDPCVHAMPAVEWPATVEGLIEVLKSFADFKGSPVLQWGHQEGGNLLARGEEGTPWRHLVEAAESAAESVLITAGGRPNHLAMARLKEAGFRVYPGETDGFGWLTGCIDLQVGETPATLVYG